MGGAQPSRPSFASGGSSGRPAAGVNGDKVGGVVRDVEATGLKPGRRRRGTVAGIRDLLWKELPGGRQDLFVTRNIFILSWPYEILI